MKYYPYKIIFILLTIMCCSLVSLYSATSSFDPRWMRQLYFFIFGLGLCLFLSLISNYFWLQISYIGLIGALLLLILVHFLGYHTLGAQRWISILGFRFQPSEIIKIPVILCLVRFYSQINATEILSTKSIIGFCAIILFPAFLVLKQPDLGTSLIIILLGVMILFVIGLPWKTITYGSMVLLTLCPLFWILLHQYQKQRIISFLNPYHDPYGSGYNIIQSLIAIGSGGIWGKGFLQGTQNHLNFLPEKHTDFIFALFLEEWGFMGGLFLLSLYFWLIFEIFSLALKCRDYRHSLIAYGVACYLFLHVCMNMAMVTGLLPTVGIPLPLMSYGGTSILSFMIALSFVFQVYRVQYKQKKPYIY